MQILVLQRKKIEYVSSNFNRGYSEVKDHYDGLYDFGYHLCSISLKKAIAVLFIVKQKVLS